ncbi:MAG: leucyl aminopeptidase family protein [Flavobacteriales bacterium]
MIRLENQNKQNADALIYCFQQDADFDALPNAKPIRRKAKAQLKAKLASFQIEFEQQLYFFVNIKTHNNKNDQTEAYRKAGAVIQAYAKTQQWTHLQCFESFSKRRFSQALAMGLVLSDYTFEKYKNKTAQASGESSFSIASACFSDLKKEDLIVLNAQLKGVYAARDLVNEPQSFLTASQMSKEIKILSEQSGFEVDVMKKAEIEALEMGGLLAVNKGSVQPPRFNILTHKPKHAKNKKPLVFVGKGIVYDTGGLSLKPTAKSMDFMKSDMGGAAAVIGLIHALALANTPVYAIGLIPATDNRPSLDAYAPGDVITMMSKKTVEVMNTDAEGRLVLADALHYAKRLKPEYVVDLATLTGAAVAAFGNRAICGMGNDTKHLADIETAGYSSYERVVPQPFWDDFGDQIKSSIADISNLGTPGAGHITAGKFLEHFVDYPWVHLDIAGPAFLHAKQEYKTIGGTGVGVRLLFEFVNQNI